MESVSGAFLPFGLYTIAPAPSSVEGRSSLDDHVTLAIIKSPNKRSFTGVCQVKRFKLKVAPFPTPKIHIPSDDCLFFDVTKPVFDLDVQRRLKALSQLGEAALNGIETIDVGINVMTVRFNSLVISPTRLAEWLRHHWQLINHHQEER